MAHTGPQVIVVGGGLAGNSAAHTVLERGGRVLMVDKMPFLGGNSAKGVNLETAAVRALFFLCELRRRPFGSLGYHCTGLLEYIKQPLEGRFEHNK